MDFILLSGPGALLLSCMPTWYQGFWSGALRALMVDVYSRLAIEH